MSEPEPRAREPLRSVLHRWLLIGRAEVRGSKIDEYPTKDFGRWAAAFREIYDDGQSFARHYDEKLRSLITALSFLTVAGITLFIFSTPKVSPNDLTFDGRSWNTANVFFVVFLSFVTLSLASAAAGMDPSAHRPHFLGHESENAESILFYERIAGDAAWEEHFERKVERLEAALARSYARDAYALARRARHKVMRTAMAQAQMEVAIAALLLLGLARLPSSSAGTRADLLLVAVVAISALPIATFGLLRSQDYPTVGELRLLRRESADQTRVFLPWFLFFVLPPIVVLIYAARARFDGGSYWAALLGGLGWTIASRFLLFLPALSPRRAAAGKQPRVFTSAPVVALGVCLVGLLLLAYPGMRRGYPRIDVRAFYAVTPSRGVICVYLHGPADQTPYVSLNGGKASINQQYPVPLDDRGHGIVAIPIARPLGYYRLTVRIYPTDLDEARVVHLNATGLTRRPTPSGCFF